MHEAVKDWLAQCRDKLCTEAITAADLDRPRLPYATEVESYRDRVRRIRTWNWLCGIDQETALRWETSQPVSELIKEGTP